MLTAVVLISVLAAYAAGFVFGHQSGFSQGFSLGGEAVTVRRIRTFLASWGQSPGDDDVRR